MIKEPFKFLDSYGKEDSNIFFGREIEIEEIYSRLFLDNLLLIYGPSGTGKTSILQCGVANRFSEEDWKPIFIRRKGNVIDSINRELEKYAITKLKENISISDKLYSIYLDYLTPIYLIFDQFEELFIFGDKKEKEELIQFIRSVNSNKDLNTHIILSIREEYLASLSEFEDEIPTLFNNRIRIEKMKRNKAIMVIEEPCKVCDVGIGKGVSAKILDILTDDSGNIELTWLQVLMDGLYKKAQKKSSKIEINEKDLEGLRRIGDVLGSFLEDQLRQMPNGSDGEAVLKTMISSDGTKKQCSLNEISDLLKESGHSIDKDKILEIIQYFIKVRIISDKDDNQRYELKHDSLAAKIFERLTLFEKELLEVRNFIEYAYNNFQSRGKFLSKEDLKFILPYEDNLIISAELTTFIDNSKKEINKLRRRKRVLLLILSIALLIIMAGFTTWAIIERGKAIEQKAKAERQTIIAQEQRDIADSQKIEIEETNVFLELAKDEAINAKVIVENQLYENMKNSLSVSPLKMNVLYKEVVNPISITASGIADDKIIPNIFGYAKHGINDSIRLFGVARMNRVGNQYFIEDIRPDVYLIYIGAIGISNNGDTLRLGHKPFRIKNFPGPFVSLGGNEGGNISKSDILGLERLTIFSYSDFNIDFKIEGFSLKIINLEGIPQIAVSDNELISEEQKKMIEKSEPGYKMILSDIDIDGPEKIDKVLNSPLTYIIDGDIYDKEREKIYKINQIINLAREYNDSALYAYRILKEAYKIDPTNRTLNTEIINVFYQIQKQYFEHIGSGYNDIMYTNKFGVFAINDVTANQNDLNDEKHRIRNGIYHYHNSLLDTIYASNDYIMDCRYFSREDLFVVLEKRNDGVVILIIDDTGNIRNSITPINSNVKSIHGSFDSKFIILTSVGASGFMNNYDARAVLLDINSGEQRYLWGEKFRNLTIQESKEFYVSDININEDIGLICASFINRKSVQFWNLKGEYVDNIKVQYAPKEVIFFQDKGVLIKQLGGSRLVKYLLNSDTSYNVIIPDHYTDFSFTNDQEHIVFSNNSGTEVYNCLLEKLYEINYPDLPLSGEEYSIENDKLYITMRAQGQYVFSLSNNIDNIINILDDNTTYGNIPALSVATQIKLENITN